MALNNDVDHCRRCKDYGTVRQTHLIAPMATNMTRTKVPTPAAPKVAVESAAALACPIRRLPPKVPRGNPNGPALRPRIHELSVILGKYANAC
jgi:hypothetical protein